MATYKEIKGTQIEVLSSDPSNPVEGQVWYNSTSNVLKGQATTVTGAWATGGNLNTGRDYLGGVGATKDAALAFGGGPPPAPTAKAITESYNGTSWTEVSDMNSAKAFVAGAGIYTSAIASGGDQYSGVAESWNGTNWTSITNEPNGSNAYGGAGADNTNALFFGGSPAGGKANTRYWNGSSWTDLNNMNTARSGLAASGKTYTAALAFGGVTSPYPTKCAQTESFNGTNWTEVSDLGTARYFLGGAGTQTSALAFGGNDPSPGATEEWNGTNWTETTNLSTARYALAAAGANNGNALAFGGHPNRTATESWTGAGASVTKTFDDS